MKTVDIRLPKSQKTLLKELIGKEFKKFRCDKFHFRPAVYQIIGLFVGDNQYALKNEIQPIDYYGSEEDVAVLSFDQVDEQEISSHVIGGKQVDTPINQQINNIRLVEDTHIMSLGEEDAYRFSYTKAIIFDLKDRQIVLEKDIWFSEDILIYRGLNAESKIAAPEAELEESDVCQFRAERRFESLL
ncbi:MAG: hypothetical protein Q4A43_05965 [Coriobacteriia bacterium]|nr:hypothetical protein [Coriobacteriia bacterium]